ncbi:HAMP domain-containing sensor histidine kinase [Vagococcus fluvialis]|uniref:HAMP domain-containing sensor histidine kinase n=1 Tax=Vagococcus fluvialis TaxID=2738 RepID=UPI003B5BAD4C
MFNKLSLRIRLSLGVMFILLICTLFLTLALNRSAINMTNTIEAGVSVPAMSLEEAQPIEAAPTVNQIQQSYQLRSFLLLSLIIILGGLATYLLIKKLLSPLETLEKAMDKRTVSNLAENIPLPKYDDEIASLTTSFNDMTNKLNDSFIIQQNFSAHAAHELRTPLAVLKTKLDVFRKKEHRELIEYNQLLDNFDKQIQRLSEIVDSLLTLSQPVDETELKSIHLNETIQEIVTELNPLYPSIKTIIKLDSSIIYGHPGLIHQALFNVIENSFKYSFEDGTVSIQLSDIQRRPTLMISDQGPGISEEDKSLIFNPFYRVEESRNRRLGGSGLGLTLVKYVLDNHQGTITISDNSPQGSIFTLTFNEKKQELT